MSKGHSVIIVDALWGDSGKSKIGAKICQDENYDIVCRAGSGINCGHSLILNGETIKTNQFPLPGILPNKNGKHPLMGVGPGVMFSPEKGRNEIEKYGIKTQFVDRLCSLILPKHVEMEKSGENYSETHTGSTKSGTGAARLDRISRTGLLVRDLPKEEQKYFNAVNVSKFINEEYDNGKKIMVCGSQGYYLSLYCSEEYPVVTSCNATSTSFADSVGLSYSRIDEVCMVIKSAPTRVSQKCGFLPGEISKEKIEELGVTEYGVTTGRLRRKSLIIPFDLLEEAVLVNAPTYFALTFCDHIDSLTFNGPPPSVVSRDGIKEYMPKTYDNIMELEKRFNIPVKYIEYGKEFNCVSEVKG